MNLKRKQILTATLVIALGAAVLVNWYYNDSVNKSDMEGSVLNENESVSGNLGDSVLVAGTVEYTTEITTQSDNDNSTEEYFSQAKIKRTQVNDKLSDTIEEILENKSFEQADIKRLEKCYKEYCDVLKWQTDAENLIYAKTGQNCIVIINSGSCQVIVDKNTLNDSVILQITGIIEENTNISVENLSIIEAK